MAKQKIAILEDDPILVKSLSQTLIAAGYEIFSSLDGETGLEIIKKQKPDLVLLDIILPRKSGFEVMENLALDPELRRIPVMVLTNLESSQDINRMTELGVKSFLVKTNYSLDEVAAKIKETLNKLGNK
ncbi:MAG: response regulator [Candidatus Niyogibacteria bacterium]|nr:MAG: response regulator [Candidatus Niyogibacteria bacterium]